MRSTSAVAASEWLAKRRALPKTITLHNASELTSNALDERAEVNGVTLNLMRPGKAIENGVLASFNGRLGDECLTHQVFKTLARTMQLVGACRAAPPQGQDGPPAFGLATVCSSGSLSNPTMEGANERPDAMRAERLARGRITRCGFV